MRCGSSSKKEKKNKYRCNDCGTVSDMPKECCGKPMKKAK